MNNAAKNREVQISDQDSDFIYFRYIPRSEMAGSYGSSVFYFFEEPQKIENLFSIVAPPFYIPINKARGFHTFSPHLHQHLISLVFLVTNILRVVRWSPIVVLIHFYLIISHVSNFSCAFLDIYISSTFIHILCPFLNRFFCIALVVWVLHIFLNINPYQIDGLQNFSPIL